MPDLPESLHPAEEVAIPPIVDPSKFEDLPAYRETFLLYVTDPTANAALRGQGRLTYDLILEYWGKWPDHPEGLLRASLRAAVADMRCVQGFLLELEEGAYPTAHENFLAAVGAEIGVEVGELADRIEKDLGAWRGEE